MGLLARLHASQNQRPSSTIMECLPLPENHQTFYTKAQFNIYTSNTSYKMFRQFQLRQFQNISLCFPFASVIFHIKHLTLYLSTSFCSFTDIIVCSSIFLNFSCQFSKNSSNRYVLLLHGIKS